MPFLLLREKGPALAVSDYAAGGPVDGGKYWGDMDPASKSIMIGQRMPIKTIGAAYSVVAADTGSLLVVRSGASCTITLPVVAAALKGVDVIIFNAASQTMVVASTADQMITFNDLDADAVTFSTGSNLIGACVRCVCDGTSWLVFPYGANTMTVTT